MSYRQLDPERIVQTAHRLSLRVNDRFPASGLAQVAREVEAAAGGAHQLRLKKDYGLIALRVFSVSFIALLFLLFVYLLSTLDLSRLSAPRWTELLQSMEALINEVVFLGIAVFFVLTLDNRARRMRSLKALHELRSLAHVIDMHQLTKDPEHSIRSVVVTEHSPARNMSRGDLERYLDYCSEMLSMLSKIAAMHGEHTADAVVLNSVDAIEELTSGLSQKIWQKIMILSQAGAA